MSEVDEAARAMSGTAASALQVAMAAAERQARQRAERLRNAAAESEQAREKARQALRAEANVQAARWAALANAGPDWVEDYASAAQWRELDPRAAAAAHQAEDSLRTAGVDLPDTGNIRRVNEETLNHLGGQRPSERAGTRDRVASSSGMGVDVSVHAAEPVELGQRFHPRPLNPAGRRQRAHAPSTPAHCWDQQLQRVNRVRPTPRSSERA
jgi:hypothetical protein